MRLRTIVVILVVVLISASALFIYSGEKPVPSTENKKTLPPPAIVAVIDTGIDESHPEFYSGQVVAWIDFINGKNTPYDDNGHGTATASVVGGQTLGVFPEVGLAVAKALDKDGVGNLDATRNAIYWAVNEAHANVISMSISTDSFISGAEDPVEDAIKYAYDAGVIVVVAAGNGYSLPSGNAIPLPSELVSPSSSPYSIVVGASDENGVRASFSNLDPEVMAQGVRVPVALPDGAYASADGTSFACPYVAGMAAKLYVSAEDKSPAHIEYVILHTATPVSHIYSFEGYGVVNLNKALAEINTMDSTGRSETLSLRIYDFVHSLSDGVREIWTIG